MESMTFTPCVESFTSPGIDTRYMRELTALSVFSERHRDTQSLFLRARFVHLTCLVRAGDRTPTSGVPSGRANDYTTTPQMANGCQPEAQHQARGREALISLGGRNHGALENNCVASLCCS